MSPSPAYPPPFPPPQPPTVMTSKQHLPPPTPARRSPTDWAMTTTPASSSRSSYSDPSSRSTDASSTVVGSNTRREDPADEEDVNSAFEREAYGTPTGEKADPFEVKMGPEDPDNPQKWSRAYRWYITMLAAILLLNATFASSIPTGIITDLEQQFAFSAEVGTLTISIFVVGYCVGPLLWGPLSEYVGRKPVFLGTFVVYTGMQVGCALAPNTAALLVFRFLGGTFAAAPLANSGAVISDIWDADTRGKALAVFTLAPFAGPSLGPTVSGWMSVAGVSWRWVFWLLTCFAGFLSVLVLLTLPETFVPVLLIQRAKTLRKETGDDRYWAPLERNQMSLGHKVSHILSRPFLVLAYEPMLIAITIYMSFVYGCIYLLFEAFPIVFTEGHGFNAGFTGLTFLSVFIGGCIGVLIYLTIYNPRYERLMKEFAPYPVPPEYRLEICMVAAPVFAISFFWFGWTSFPSVSYWAPLAAGIPLGASIVFIFLGLFNYMIDAYLFVAASALSANTIVRSLFGAGFPLFAAQMYDRLNPQWASSLLGFIAILLGPIPFLLRAYGHHLRKRSRYAPTGHLPLTPPKKDEKGVVIEEP